MKAKCIVVKDQENSRSIGVLPTFPYLQGPVETPFGPRLQPCFAELLKPCGCNVNEVCE